MGKIQRDFNGYISFPFVFVDNKIASYMDMEVHSDSLKKYENEKTVYVIEENFSSHWKEYPVSVWFSENYEDLGFNKIVQERSKEYNQLKSELGFNLWPDYLAKKEGQWLRVEIECWVHKYEYTHPKGYADVVIAFDSYREEPNNIEVYTMKKYLGAKELISLPETMVFMYLYDEYFKTDYDQAVMMDLKNGMKKS